MYILEPYPIAFKTTSPPMPIAHSAHSSEVSPLQPTNRSTGSKGVHFSGTLASRCSLATHLKQTYRPTCLKSCARPRFTEPLCLHSDSARSVARRHPQLFLGDTWHQGGRPKLTKDRSKSQMPPQAGQPHRIRARVYSCGLAHPVRHASALQDCGQA